MYLMPSNSGAVNNRKWNLGRLGCNCSARGIGTPPQKRMGQLGQAPGVPAGTILAYSANWKRTGWAGPLTVGWNDPNGVQSAIQQNLASQWGIVIDAQQHSTSDIINASGQSGFVLQVHTTSDYGAAGDIQSIIDGAIYAVGNQMPSSTIRIVQAGSSSSNPNAPYPASVAAAVTAAQAGLADAQARGDSVTAAQFAAQIQQLTGTNPLGPGTSLTSWFSNNWALLAAGGIALVAAKEL